MKRSAKPYPPNLFLRFFRWYCHPDLLYHIEGDLMELYHERHDTSGKRKADIKFIVDVLLLFRPGIIKPSSSYHNLNHYAMIKSYLKIGIRNLLKYKGYSFINIGGLATGMAVAIIIGLWVYDELSFNHYHTNYPRIAQVIKGGVFQGKHFIGQDYLPYPLIEELQSTYGANFKHVVPTSGPGGFGAVLSAGDKKLSRTGMYIGEAAPEMFTWRMKYGTWSGLNDLHSVMVSESTAQAFFGNDDPLGKPLKVNGTTDVVVTGVYEDFPKNSAFHGINFFEPWKFRLKREDWIAKQGWENHFLMIYVEIQPNISMERASANIFNAEMNAIKNIDYLKEEMQYKPEVHLLPMDKWHLYSNFKEGVLQNGPVQIVWFMGAIGIFVLLLACINFMNLSTARSEKRAKEVGIRKTIGSVRRQLIGQFFSESFLVVILSFIVALVIVGASLPWFNQLAGKAMTMPWHLAGFWLTALGFILITGLLAGSYPALYLSSFNPVHILKGTFRLRNTASIPRKVLVTLQFTVSVILMICTGVIYHQIMFVKDRPVGYSREGLISMWKKSDEYNKQANVLRTELKATGAVIEVAEAGGEVTGIWSNNGGFTWKGKDPNKQEDGFATLNITPEFGKTVGWQFIDGRDFLTTMAGDSSAMVINESAAKEMGLENPVGEVIHWANRPWGVDKDFTIIGVIKDMVMESPFEPTRPSVYFTFGYKGVLLLRLNPAMSTSEAIAKIEPVFTKVIPDLPFEYNFVDQSYAAKFRAEERIGKLAAVFACLAIFISCLGLFGLASFVAEQRTKEIGIRKVLGASVANLWGMLSKEFVGLVVLACLIAIPIAYYILDEWLKEYAYRTAISGWILTTAGLGALAITLLTVSYQSIRAALANPVKSLRSE